MSAILRSLASAPRPRTHARGCAQRRAASEGGNSGERSHINAVPHDLCSARSGVVDFTPEARRPFPGRCIVRANADKSYMTTCGRLWLGAHYTRRLLCDTIDYVRHNGPLCAHTCTIITIIIIMLIIMCGIMRLCAQLCAECYVPRGGVYAGDWPAEGNRPQPPLGPSVKIDLQHTVLTNRLPAKQLLGDTPQNPKLAPANNPHIIRT